MSFTSWTNSMLLPSQRISLSPSENRPWRLTRKFLVKLSRWSQQSSIHKTWWCWIWWTLNGLNVDPCEAGGNNITLRLQPPMDSCCYTSSAKQNDLHDSKPPWLFLSHVNAYRWSVSNRTKHLRFSEFMVSPDIFIGIFKLHVAESKISCWVYGYLMGLSGWWFSMKLTINQLPDGDC